MDLQGRRWYLIVGYDALKLIQIILQLICLVIALARSSEDRIYIWIFIPNGMLLLFNSILFGRQFQNPSKSIEEAILTGFLVAYVPMIIVTAFYYLTFSKKDHEHESMSKFYNETDSDESLHNNTNPIFMTTTAWSEFLHLFYPFGPFTGYKVDESVGFPAFYGLFFTGTLVVLEIIVYYATRKLQKVQIQIDEELASDDPVTGCEWYPPAADPIGEEPRLEPQPSSKASDKARVEDEALLLLLGAKKKGAKKKKSSYDLHWEKVGQY